MLAGLFAPLATGSQQLTTGVVVGTTSTGVGEVAEFDTSATVTLANCGIRVSVRPTLDPTDSCRVAHTLAIVLKNSGRKFGFVHDSILVTGKAIALPRAYLEVKLVDSMGDVLSFLYDFHNVLQGEENNGDAVLTR